VISLIASILLGLK